MRLFFSSILILISCLFLNAEEAGNEGIYFGNTEIYGEEFLIVFQQNTSSNAAKKVAKTIKETPSTVNKEKVSKQKPSSTLFNFPIQPSSSSYLHGGNESAAISLQHRFGGNQQVGKFNRGNVYTNICSLSFSLYFSEQRQKLSIAATQCGELTSFGAQSPPCTFHPSPQRGLRVKPAMTI